MRNGSETDFRRAKSVWTNLDDQRSALDRRIGNVSQTYSATACGTLEGARRNISVKLRNESSFTKTRLRAKCEIDAGGTHPKNDFGVGLEIDL